jgi:hypothetical protein
MQSSISKDQTRRERRFELSTRFDFNNPFDCKICVTASVFILDYASKDPFRQFLPRFLYEQRFRRKAPIPPKYNEIIRRR